MLPVEPSLAERLRGAVARVVGTTWEGEIPIEVSHRPDLGDYASPVAFVLAKMARRPPLEIARALAADLQLADDADIEAVSASAPGFVNFRLSPVFLGRVVQLAHQTTGRIGNSDVGAGTKVVIEHTNINPNKAAHVGHFRNACLGDTLARILRRLGYEVEVQNYIDDTGVQVADVVVGLRHFGAQAPDGVPFDRHCSNVYMAVQVAYEQDPDLRNKRAEVQEAIERGEGDTAEYARNVAQRVAAANLATMARAGVEYDLLTWESDILGSGFWQSAFERLKAAGAVRFEKSGPNAGCWVMPFGEGSVETTHKTLSEDKVLVTSRGIATYTAKDIAYQLWKFGLLGRDFKYRRWREHPGGRPLWTSTPGPGEDDPPRFGHADIVINVIDATQAYPQQVVYAGLRSLGHDQAADHSEHLAYERVVLAPAAARELGIVVPTGSKSVAMSGRGGVQVFADELLDRLAERASERAAAPPVAQAIAAGAARYYMLKFSHTQQIAFDFDEALRTVGETGVYLQYAYVRAGAILGKLDDPSPPPVTPPSPVPPHDRQLVLRMAQYPAALAAAGVDRSAMTVAKYAFDLATAFNAFYDNTPPVVRERDEALRAWRAGLVAAFRLVMADVLDALGIPAVERI